MFTGIILKSTSATILSMNKPLACEMNNIQFFINDAYELMAKGCT